MVDVVVALVVVAHVAAVRGVIQDVRGALKVVHHHVRIAVTTVLLDVVLNAQVPVAAHVRRVVVDVLEVVKDALGVQVVVDLVLADVLQAEKDHRALNVLDVLDAQVLAHHVRLVVDVVDVVDVMDVVDVIAVVDVVVIVLVPVVAIVHHVQVVLQVVVDVADVLLVVDVVDVVDVRHNVKVDVHHHA